MTPVALKRGNLFWNRAFYLIDCRVWTWFYPPHTHTQQKVNSRFTLNSFYAVYVFLPLHILYIMSICTLCFSGSFYSIRCPYMFFKGLDVSYPSIWCLLQTALPLLPQFTLSDTLFPFSTLYNLAYSFPGDTPLIPRCLSSCLTFMGTKI